MLKCVVFFVKLEYGNRTYQIVKLAKLVWSKQMLTLDVENQETEKNTSKLNIPLSVNAVKGTKDWSKVNACVLLCLNL